METVDEIKKKRCGWLAPGILPEARYPRQASGSPCMLQRPHKQKDEQRGGYCNLPNLACGGYFEVSELILVKWIMGACNLAACALAALQLATLQPAACAAQSCMLQPPAASSLAPCSLQPCIHQPAPWAVHPTVLQPPCDISLQPQPATCNLCLATLNIAAVQPGSLEGVGGIGRRPWNNMQDVPAQRNNRACVWRALLVEMECPRRASLAASIAFSSDKMRPHRERERAREREREREWEW